MQIETVLFGALSGLFVAGAGYLKSRNAELFDIEKFVPTVVLGGVIGAGVMITGLTPDMFTMILSTAGATHLIESTWKAIVRYFRR